MILQRPVKNLNEYENEISSIESTLIMWVIKGEPNYNPKSAHQGIITLIFLFLIVEFLLFWIRNSTSK